MNPFDLIRNFPIRYKLLFIYSSCFIVVMSLSSLIIYSIVKQNVEANIESELKNSTSAIHNTVKTAVYVSIKNRLRGVAEKNYEIIEDLYNRSQRGEISNEAAMKMGADIILSQSIGISGYICILDGQGRVLRHPKKSLEGLDISDHRFVQEMIAIKDGYIEYEWQNPGDDHPRPKALYLNYFEPWNWMITVSSYRKEFLKLVDVKDFKDGILSLKFGDTGYSYVMDTKGNIIIHPELTGINVFEDKRFSAQFFKEMLEKKNGKLYYSWKNPGETRYREKLVFFNYIPEYEWIVASSSYLDEIRSPLFAIKQIIVLVGMAALVLFIPITAFLSETITKPLHSLMGRFKEDIAGGFSNRGVTMGSRDEVGQLAFYYNSFMDRLDAYDRELNNEIHERRQVQEALTESEEKYRSVMESVPDPIVVYDMSGKVTYMNPAFTKVFGYTLEDCLGNKLDHFVPKAHWKETMEGIRSILNGEIIPRLETKRKAKDGKLIDVTTRGSVYRDKNGEPLGSVIIHRDVSQVKHLEKSIMEIGEKERQAIGNDLHDDLCPHLIGIEGLVKVLKRKAGENNPDVEKLSDKISDLIKEAISKTRGLARGLCPVYFKHGLNTSLEDLVTNTRMIHDVDCRLEISEGLKIDNHMVTLNLYHIAGEAVRNAIRHGKADRIIISMAIKDNQMEFSIQDNGTGIDPVPGAKGMGLRIMNYRAKIVGASLVVSSEKGKGTTVKLTMLDAALLED
ncbi:MAG: cache domain-containing protein [Desulfobacterales bacterium]|nr:cache domain-containing protein [Desulfobacterales bacterium]